MLLAIAVLPLRVPHWWESNRHKLAVAAALGAPVLAFYLVREPGVLAHTARDYVSFMILLGGLYVISGGIRLEGDLEATPAVNSAFLAIGALLASVIGTTGASMLLIRPLLMTNRERTRVTHTVVFFIFLVSNIGGMLTPLGDPPLFLGYLAGVPFTWTFRLWLPWTTMVILLLAAYFVWDTRAYTREPLAAIQRDRRQRAGAGRRGGGGCLSGDAGARARDRRARRALVLADAGRDPPSQRLHELPDRGSRRAVPRDLPDDDPRPRAAARAGRRARSA
jgi:Na+/H+ antiporter NhaD/arsenite permease-like protein